MTDHTEPWSATRAQVTTACTVVSLMVLVLSWIAANGQAEVRDQLGWLTLAALATGIAGIAAAQWILAGRRAVGVLRRQLLTADRLAPRQAAAATTPAVNGGSFVASPAMTRFHRPECRLAVDKPVRPVPSSVIRRRALQPCGICQPGPGS